MFLNCLELTKITIAKEVTEIGEQEFSYATGLREVIFETGSLLKDIDDMVRSPMLRVFLFLAQKYSM